MMRQTGDYEESVNKVQMRRKNKRWNSHIDALVGCKIGRNAMIYVYDRLTLDEIVEKYPYRWLGVVTVAWQDGKIFSAIIKYKDKTPDELQALIKQGEIDFALMVMQDGICSIGDKVI